MSLNFVRDKLNRAVERLDGDAGSLQERLSAAAMSCHILVAPPQLDDGFPSPETKRRFRSWWCSMTSKSGVEDEGVLEATVAAMSDDTAAVLAHDLRALSAELNGST